MKYAVIKSGGKQYRVSEGDIIEVDRLPDTKRKLSFEDVLLFVSDGSVKIGRPYVSGEKVEASLVENLKGDKIRVSKYKAKVRYRRTIGFRPYLSKIKIEKIGSMSSSRKNNPAAKKR